MTTKSLQKAIDEARRFLIAAEAVSIVQKSSIRTGSYMAIEPGKAAAACKRASMDLTRALAELRRPG